MFPIQIETRASDGARQMFSLEVLGKSDAELLIRVFDPGEADFFEARFVRFGGDSLRSDMLRTHSTRYSGKGITTALFKMIVRVTGLAILSSSNKNQGNGEFRSIDMDRIWRHYVNTRRATYDAGTDRFRWTTDTPTQSSPSTA